jgi:hypothetical protein
MAPRHIFHEAHYEAFGFRGVDHNRWYFSLTQHSECLKPPFTTNEVVTDGTSAGSTADRYGTLEANGFDIVDDFTM